MAKLEVLTYGFTLMTNQGSVGYSTNSLLSYGNQTILVDTGPPSRRGLLVESLKEHGMTPADVDIVILTHLHWDHCLNTDLFKNSRILVHPVELDYARNPNPGDHACATYVADMLARLKVEPVSEGDAVVDGLTIMDTPGHTKGHISVQAELDGEKTLIAGDALPDGGAVERGLPYNIFWDMNDARDSVEKMVESSTVFYPGHDLPFKLNGKEISYLDGPTNLEIITTNQGGQAPTISCTVHEVREGNHNPVQKG